MTVKATGAEIVRSGLADIGAEVPRIARKDIYDMMTEVRRIMQTPGKRISYPVKWDSDKQRRYVIAMLRSKNNLPYNRTDGLPKGWKIENVGNGYRLSNPAKAAVYVYGNYEGERQSRIHQQRHPVAQEVIESRIMELPPAIEEHITYFARNRGF
jgi:hypothetical protein